MNKIFNITKKQIFILSLFITIFSLAFIIIQSKNKLDQNFSKNNNDNGNQMSNIRKIIPGKTSIDEANILLGKPLETNSDGNITTSKYKTLNEYRSNKIISKDGLSELIVEEIINNEKTAEDIRKVYGISPVILYEKTPLSTFNLYVYSDKGIAYLGHKDGTILQIWYFSPTTIADFITKWGGDYLKEPSKVIPKY